MASIQKHTKGWRAQVDRKGVRRSKVLPTKREAQDWAARQEWEISNGSAAASRQKFGDVLTRYAREVSSTKRGERWEVIRLTRLQGDDIAAKAIGDLTAQDFADWRDARLREVSSASVRREMHLLGSVMTQARREWGLITHNPMADVRKPPDSPPRDRLPTKSEMEKMQHVAGDDLATATARAFHAFRFACETAMRAGEILGLTGETLDETARVATLPMTKNGSAREVPLSSEALRLWQDLPGDGFDLTARQLDTLFRKVRDKAGIEGLRFHDSRAAGTTKLAAKVDVLTLARITGHRDLKMLQVYYRESAADLAKRLD
ncbi:MAG TPA: site-specific integrase [Alphaproteobacteria bacterium]|nr:site-specific integrase [Alphaproteobacteria bacterium]